MCVRNDCDQNLQGTVDDDMKVNKGVDSTMGAHNCLSAPEVVIGHRVGVLYRDSWDGFI